MTPTSSKPLNKVTYGAVAAAVSLIVLALVKNYLWKDMPADLEGPLNTVIAAGVAGLASGAAGWFTPIAPGEITNRDKRAIDAQEPKP